RAQHFDAAIGALDPVAACLGISAALDSARRHTPAVGEDVGAHGFDEGYGANDTVAAPVRARAARAAANGELVEAHGKPRFEDLRVGQAAVGHVRLNRAGAIEIRPRAGADRKST